MGRGAQSKQYAPIQDAEAEDQAFLKPADGQTVAANEKMDVLQTAKLGFSFGLLWVKTSPTANYPYADRHSSRYCNGLQATPDPAY